MPRRGHAHLLLVAHDAGTDNVQGVLDNSFPDASVLDPAVGQGLDELGEDEPADHEANRLLIDDIIDESVNVSGEGGLIFACDELCKQ